MAVGKNNYSNLKAITLPELKEREAVHTERIQKQNNDIAETVKKYEKDSSSFQSKRGIRSSLAIFIVLIIIASFFQPSIALFPADGHIAVQNFSDRTIEHIRIISFGNIMNGTPSATIPTLGKKETRTTPPLPEGWYVSFATKQLPWITYVGAATADTAQVNKSEDNHVYDGLKQQTGDTNS